MSKTIIIIFSLFAAIGLAIGILWPKYQVLNELRAEVNVKKTELQELENYYSGLEDALEEIKKHPESLAKIESALPNSPDLPSLLLFLQKKASENGLVFKNVGAFSASPKKDKKLLVTTLDFELSGSYSSLKNFLLPLEKTDRLIEVESISFSFPTQERKAAQEVIFPFSFQIKTHSYNIGI